MALSPKVSFVVVPRHQTAVLPSIKFVDVLVGRQAAVVLEAGWTDVPHHAIVWAEVFAPAEDHPVVPLPWVVKPTEHIGVQVHWRAWVVPNLVRAAVTFQNRQIGVAKCKPCHLSPLRSQEWWGLCEKFTTLVDGKAQLHGLPKVGVLQTTGAWDLGQNVGLPWRVARRSKIILLIRPVAHAVFDQLGSQVIAQGRCPSIGVVHGHVVGVELEEDHQGKDVRHGRLCLRTLRIAVLDQAVHRVAQGHLLGFLTQGQIRRHIQRRFIERTEKPVVVLPKEHRRGLRGVVGGPAVVHQDAAVVEIPCMDGGTGEIIADGFEHLLAPLMRHGGLRQHGQACQTQQPCTRQPALHSLGNPFHRGHCQKANLRNSSQRGIQLALDLTGGGVARAAIVR